jgi:hypothetical protein
VYARFKATGLQPDSSILGRLFRVVRNYAQLVRAESGRRAAALPGGDKWVPGRRGAAAAAAAAAAGADAERAAEAFMLSLFNPG